MAKVLRVKDLFNQVDEKYGIRMSQVGLLDFLPSDYFSAYIERNLRNHCRLFIGKFNAPPLLDCKISFNAPLSMISACCSDFKLG